jgi:hypothetical protein
MLITERLLKIYNMFIIRFIKKLIREYKYRKRLKELRKRDPFIY